MSSIKTIALLGSLAPCFALVLTSAGFAQSSNSHLSTPAEQAQTQKYNQNVIDANNAATKQNNINQEKYQAQLKIYRMRIKNYNEQAANYEAERDQYIAQRAHYRRGKWPSRYESNIIVDTDKLLGSPVHTSDGHTVGHVEEIALLSGHVDALRVTLDHNKGDVWVESADLRFDAKKNVVLTNLNSLDLYDMTH
jgi:sporulation protein YlmC with PRC-barrel domain